MSYTGDDDLLRPLPTLRDRNGFRHLAQAHAAYDVLVDGFRASTRSPEHLAYLALLALQGRFHVVADAGGEFHLDYRLLEEELADARLDLHAHYAREFLHRAVDAGYSPLTLPRRQELPSSDWPGLRHFRLSAPAVRLEAP